jgi:hypothetical protein
MPGKPAKGEPPFGAQAGIRKHEDFFSLCRFTLEDEDRPKESQGESITLFQLQAPVNVAPGSGEITKGSPHLRRAKVKGEAGAIGCQAQVNAAQSGGGLPEAEGPEGRHSPNPEKQAECGTEQGTIQEESKLAQDVQQEICKTMQESRGKV